jgi:HSP20 family protein
MAEVARFSPFRNLARLDPFGREFDDLFKGFLLTPLPAQQTAAGSRIPIDISEDETSYKVRAEIPGFSKEDIQISVHGDEVSISAETKRDKEEKTGETVVLRECYYGKQYRAFTLAQAVDDAKASAKYADGVLELVLPKKESAVTRKIAIE